MSSDVRSPWALVILSLLAEADRHPYQMRRLCREPGKDALLDLPPGGLYRTVDRLARLGLVEPVETSRQGRFPERTVYRITPRGADELHQWMRSIISVPGREFADLVAALTHVANLEADDALAQLEARMPRLEAEIAGFDALMRSLSRSVPRAFLLAVELVRALRQAELEWVRSIVADLRSGELTWGRVQPLKQFSPSAQRGSAR